MKLNQGGEIRKEHCPPIFFTNVMRLIKTGVVIDNAADEWRKKAGKLFLISLQLFASFVSSAGL